MMATYRVALFSVFALLTILSCFGRTLPEDTRLDDSSPVVEIPDGKIIGTDNVTVDKGTPYHAFRGIPFAQPPVGNLRFAAPVKNSKWSGYWDASSDAEQCVQGSEDTIRGSEDCLYINVYTPSLLKKNQSVMVWIYGGGFKGGSSRYDAFGPDYLLEEEVVFVSFNYRTGIFGFLSTTDRAASGNWGLKDQVLALQWVKDNIEYFGGDPNKVTIFGESAGAASVSYLLEIPKAQGLFSAAIMQSGTSEMLWALSTKARKTAFQVGYSLGILTIFSSTLINRLRNIDAYRLQKQASETSNQVYLTNPLRGLPFAPVIEPETDDAVFTQNSDDYLRSGNFPSKVPVLIGYNSNEGESVHGLPDRLRNYLLFFDIVPNTLAPFSMTSNEILKGIAAHEVRLFYFGVTTIRSQYDQVIKFINADQFNRPTIRVAQNIAPFAPVYFYIFGYEGQIVGNNSFSGVGHAEDLSYLFRTYTDNYSDKDLEVRAKLVRLWTNFAKTNNPTPIRDPLLDNVIWPAINPASNDTDFVWLNGTISLDKNPDHDSYAFYKSLFDQFGDQSYTTY